MNVDRRSFVRFLEGNDKSFVIPVYQRNYDWGKEQCKKLFDDIVALHKNKNKSHFLGTIVSVYHDGNDEEKLIIDGQQRITTLSLLLLALHNLLINDEKREINPDELMDYLINKYSKSRKIKLKPVKNDNEAFNKLFDGNEENVPDSKITNNYEYFKELINSSKLTLKHKEIHEAIKKLIIVEIRLSPSDDNPQMIFESLNSTGLSLSPSDLIRNFILMDIKLNEQELFYESYWRKIEEK